MHLEEQETLSVKIKFNFCSVIRWPGPHRVPQDARFFKGLASYCKAKTTFTFHFSILELSNAFLGINNREMKSESGFSFAIASQPF